MTRVRLALSSGALQQADVGPKVGLAQRMLQDLGYGGRVDEEYGPRTVQMVVKFQDVRGLAVNGEIDEATRVALNREHALWAGEQPEEVIEAMKADLDAEAERIRETRRFFE